MVYLVFEYCEHDLAGLLDSTKKPFSESDVRGRRERGGLPHGVQSRFCVCAVLIVLGKFETDRRAENGRKRGEEE